MISPPPLPSFIPDDGVIDRKKGDNGKVDKMNNLDITVNHPSVLPHRNVSEVSETNRNRVSSIVLTELEKKQLSDAIEKAMLDPEGKYNKGYFTFDELAVYRLTMSNGGWTHFKLDQVIQQLLEQGKLEEIEPEKFRPTTTIKVEKQREMERGRVSFKNGGVSLYSKEINIQKHKVILTNTIKNMLEVLVTAIVKQ